VSEERPQHTQEPAEGSDEDVEAAGAEEADEQTERITRTWHTHESAEGGDKDVEKPGAEQAEDDD
jgi:hypothetical protein